jgi:hypothetical protein
VWTVFAYLYIGFFAAGAVYSRVRDARASAPMWKALVSTVGDALGVAGMLVYVGGAPAPLIVRLWPAVFVFLVLQLVIEARYELRARLGRLDPELDPDDPQMRSLARTAVAFGVAAALPMLWLNGRLAFPDVLP